MGIRRSDKQPRALLLETLCEVSPERLQAAGLDGDVVVFAVDDELVDLDRNLGKAIPAQRRRELDASSFAQDLDLGGWARASLAALRHGSLLDR